MQGYNPDFQGHYHHVAQHSGSLQDRASPSGSEDDVGYLMYPETPRMDDDPNAALTSQALNADGTPKRPMNAFMIFARRRRPQVAAENQSMRTGEVSKVLSREWNAMSLSDKQFYLDQAKILKDNFNQKYPDYVYRRRPNNSRKRRKPDPSPGLSSDHASTSDFQDDYLGSADFSDVSPVEVVEVVEVDDARASGQDSRYQSLPADPSGSTYSTATSRASSYQSSDASYRSLGDTRIPYISRPGRSTPDAGMPSTASSAARGSDLYYHPYLPAQQQHHHHAQSSAYFPEPGSAAEAWSGSREDQSRMSMQPWSQSNQEMGADDRHRGYAQAVSSHGWANTSGSEGIPISTTPGTSTGGFGFPTLNSPFYPPQSGAQEEFSSAAVQPISVPQHYGTVASIPGSSVSGRSYPSLQQPYTSGSSSAAVSYPPSARNVPIGLPPGQPPSSSYSHSHLQSTSTPPPTGPGGDPSQTRYWSKER